MNEHKICILISTKDRATELAMLLQSLIYQTFQNFNVIIVDGSKPVPVYNTHFLMCMINRLRLQGHKLLLEVIEASGVCESRQKAVELGIKYDEGEDLFLRIDDDTILMPEYLKKLVEGIDAGYDLVSGLTPQSFSPEIMRENKFVKPIINKISLNENDELLNMGDDCWATFETEETIPTHHFRSSALYKKEIHTKHNINYKLGLSNVGFREEAFISLKCINAGLKLAVHTGAKYYHLQTPSGGVRYPNYHLLVQADQHQFNEWFKRTITKNPNLLKDYDSKVIKQ